MMVGQLNLSKYASIEKPLETITKVRYKDDGTPATIFQENGKMKVNFHESVSGVAPGQAAVFYEGNDVVGGGWILKSFKNTAPSAPSGGTFESVFNSPFGG
jgi:tRNA-uridine 2-sulfurtransferase